MVHVPSSSKDIRARVTAAKKSQKEAARELERNRKVKEAEDTRIQTQRQRALDQLPLLRNSVISHYKFYSQFRARHPHHRDLDLYHQRYLEIIERYLTQCKFLGVTPVVITTDDFAVISYA